jgi:hypothetical protein
MHSPKKIFLRAREVTGQGQRSKKKYTARHREEVTGQERVFMQKKRALRAPQGKRQDAAEPCRKRRKTKKNGAPRAREVTGRRAAAVRKKYISARSDRTEQKKSAGGRDRSRKSALRDKKGR